MTVESKPIQQVNLAQPASPKRHRLLALVQSDNRPINAERGPAAATYDLHQGDANWFFENISCQAACPAHTDVARYIAYLGDGDYEAAHHINLEDNLFPGILGRICARPCESACRRGKLDDPIAICSLKRGAADFSQGRLPDPVPRLYSERIAVIGSGPAGLAAANGLAKAGYGVVVFESQPVAGGMLRWGIPEFRLPRELCQHEIDDYFAALGVEIRLNTSIGQDLSLEQLSAKFSAVFVAAGAQTPQRLDLPQTEAAGVIAGLDYMELVNLKPEQARARTGKRVAVIGGGFTAMDCARSALRLGAEEVFVLYRRSARELVVGNYEVEEAQHEGTTFQYMVAPLAAKGKDGQSAGIVMTRTELGEPDQDGRRRPHVVPGSDFLLETDTIITATGQNPELNWLGAELAGQSHQQLADHAIFATSRPGLFAGGDFLMGPRNVISAVADGRKAAYTIARWLREKADRSENWPPLYLKTEETPLKAHFKPVLAGKDMRFQRYRQQVPPIAQEAAIRYDWQSKAEAALRLPVAPIARWTDDTMNHRLNERDPYQEIKRHPMRVIPLAERRSLATEVETGFSREDVHAEAQRCLQCQLNIFIDGAACILCNTCVDVCPTKVIKMVDLKQVILLDGESNSPDLEAARCWEHSAAMLIDEDSCIRCGECVKYCPTGCLSMQHFEPVAASKGLPPPSSQGHSIDLLGLLRV